MRCFECKKGDYTEDIAPIQGKFSVKDPDNGRVYGKGYLCDDHVDCLLTDGYVLKVC
jgi:hypothetical protein